MTQKLLRYEDGIFAATQSSYSAGLVAVSDGLVLALGDDDNNTLVAKVDFNGVLQWQRVLGPIWITALSADASGNIYAAGADGITKFDPAGAIAWKKTTPVGLTYRVKAYPASVDGVMTMSTDSPTVRRVARLGADGALAEGWTYTAATNEELYSFTLPRPISAVQHTDGDWISLSVNTAGDDFLMLVKQDATAVSGRSLKVTGFAMAPLGLCKMTDNNVVVAYRDGSGTDTDTLYLVCVDQTTATVVWSKSFETSLATNLFGGAGCINLFAVGTGFALGFADDARSPAIAVFDNAGALQWAVHASDAIAGAWGWGPTDVVAANGSIYFLADIAFDPDHSGATLIQLSDMGGAVGNFGPITLVDVAATITVAAGPTVVAAGQAPGSVATMGGASSTATIADAAAAIYPITYYSDLFQTSQVSGHKAIHHGQMNSPYKQTSQVTGHLATKHGNAMSMVHMPSGKTICATTGTKVTKHGQAVGASLFASAMTGHLAIKHGAMQGKTSHAMAGHLAIAHGVAAFASVFKMTGLRATKHGTLVTRLSRGMTGHLAVKHGTMTSKASITSQVTGHLAAKHGTASFKCIFKINPSYKTRYGVMKSVRSITC